MNLKINRFPASIAKHQIFTESCSGQSNSLQLLKIKSILVFNLLFLLGIIPIFFLRLKQENDFLLIIDSLTIFLLVYSSLLIYYKRYELSTFISAVIVPSLGFVVAFLSDAPITGIFAILCLMEGMFILVLPNWKIKIVYAAVYTFTLILIFCSKYDDPYLIFPTMIMIIACQSLFLLFSNFLEKQSKSLMEIKSSIEAANSILANANSTLLNKNDDLMTFNQIMSHDLKTPIRTIISYTGLLKRRLNLQEEEEVTYFNFIETAGKEMITLIDELMLFQKVDQESIVFEELALAQLLEDLKSKYLFEIEQNKLQFSINNIPNIYGNAAFIGILMNNLISNAKKFQPKDSNHIPNIKIEGEQIKGLVQIYLSDNGIGIDKAYIDKLFVPFKRFHSSEEYKGTGLGMAICKKVMDKHHGKIELLKTSSSGTTFKLTFRQVPTSSSR